MVRGMVMLTLLPLAAAAREPLRVPGGEPLVAVYFFGHWWDPWKSDDAAMRADFARLREMGVTCLAVDHEWSQAIDGDWRWIEREQRLAAEYGLGVLPWLSLKTWSDVSGEQRLALAKEWYGVDIVCGENQDGTPAPPLIWHDSIIEFGARYAIDYLDRYKDVATLRVDWHGELRPVICLGVESAWNGSFDDATNARFRDWLAARYDDIAAVNRAWGTAYDSLTAVDPRDTVVFDYDGEPAHPRALEDHVEFRSQTISSSLGRMADRVRAAHPEVLFMAEVPYQYGSLHPHAEGYRVSYGANPSSCDYADLVLFRNTGPLNQAEADALAAARERTGQRFVLTYRTYSDWAVPADDPRFAAAVALYGGQAAELGDGFGFYSWNEMVDVHVAYSPTPPNVGLVTEWTEEQAERAIGLLAAMVGRYRELVGVR